MKNQTELVVVTDLAILEEVFIEAVRHADGHHINNVLDRLPAYETKDLLDRPTLLAAFGEALWSNKADTGKRVMNRVRHRGACIVASTADNIQAAGGDALVRLVLAGIKAALANEDWRAVVHLCHTLAHFVRCRREYSDLLNVTLLEVMRVIGILESPYADAYPHVQAGKGMAPDARNLKALASFGAIAALLDVTDASGLESATCTILYGVQFYTYWPTWRTLGAAISRDVPRARLVLARIQDDPQAHHGAAEHLRRLIQQAEAGE